MGSYVTQLNLTDGNKLHRLVWYREKKGGQKKTAGIRTGFFGKALQGMHTTYYEHGMMHYETKQGILQSIHNPSFDEIKDSIPLGFLTMPLNEMSIKVNGSPGAGKIKANKTITLSVGDYTNALAIDLHLVREGYEQDFLKQISVAYCSESAHHTLIGIEFIKLKLFDGLKLGIILLSEITD